MKAAPVFVGRAVELDRLRSAADPQGRANPRLVVVTGPAGVGKTRLVEEAVTAFERDATVVWTRAQHVDRDQPFGSVDDLVRVLKRDAVSWPSEAGGPQLVGAIEAGIERFTSSRPLVVVAEDFHWADPASWRTLRSLAARVRDMPLSLVITIRTPFAGDGVTVLDRMRAYGAVTVDVMDLTADDIRQLATLSLGEAPDEAAESLLGRAGGNALFATEIIRSLRDAHATASPPQKRAKGLPSTLRSAVLSRLIGLGPRERQLLSLASLLGTSFAVDELAEIADRSVVEVVAELDVALRAGVVQADRHALRFSHALVADCIREDQPPAMRAALHRHIASVLSTRSSGAIRVAEHYVLAAELAENDSASGGDAEAAMWLERASKEAQLTSLPTAVSLLERSVRISLPGPEATTRRLDLAMMFLLSGRLTEAESTCRRMLEGSIDPVSPANEVQARGILAAVLSLRGPLHAGAAIEEFDRAIALAGPDGPAGHDRAFIAESLAAKAHVTIYTGRIEEAIELAEEAMDLARSSGSRAARSRAHEALALAAMAQLDPKSAQHHAEEALNWFAPSNGYGAMVVTPHLTRSLVEISAGHIDEAIAVTEDGLAICEASGHLMPRLYLLPCLAVFRLIQGNLSEAEAVSVLTNELVDDWCPEHPTAVTRAIVGYVAWLRGDQSACVSAVERAAREMWDSGAQVAIADLVAWLIASVFEGVGREREAFEFMHLVWSLIGSATGAVVMAADLVRLAKSHNPAFADDVIAELSRRARIAPSGRNRLVVDRSKAIVSGDYARLATLADECRASGLTLTEAWTLRDAAHAAVEGRHPTAEALIRQTISRFDAMDAPIASNELRALARTIGVNLRPTRTRPSTGLSETEALVAQLAADGLTNRQIGEQLFISARTVESHLTHVFAKLGIKNRVQLAAALRK